jgi:16S rRNA G966 N2-methylase RsmD
MLLPWRDVKLAIDGRELVINTSLTWLEARTLNLLADGGACLEVGSGYGYSAIVMGRHATSVLAIDPHRELTDSLATMQANLAEAGLTEKVDICALPSRQALPLLWGRGARYDLVFIDGDHHYGEVALDLEHGWPLVSPGGSLAVHDYGEDTCVDVRPAVDEFCRVARPDRTRIVDTLWIATREFEIARPQD